MELAISISATESDTLIALDDWLRREPEFRGRVTIATANPDHGTMGATREALVVALGSGGALSVLLSSLKTWFEQPKRSDVRIELHTEDGRQILVTAERISDPEEIIRDVLGHQDIQ